MNRYGTAIVFGLIVTLLAIAPQLRADGTDKFNYDEHNNTILTTSYEKDGDQGHSWWADKDNDHDWRHHWHIWHHDSGGANFGSGIGDLGGAKTDSDSGPGSTAMLAPEPSTLLLILSGFLAAGLGLALKKAAA